MSWRAHPGVWVCEKMVDCDYDESSDSRRLSYYVAMYWRTCGVLVEVGDATACPCDGGDSK